MSNRATERLLLTSAQAGILLGKSAKTVVRMAERGELHVAAKLPGPKGHHLFDAKEVQAKALEQVQDEARKRDAGTLFEPENPESGDQS